MSADRSATYNNAGCRMMAIDNKRVALDLFQASLESKLAYERVQGMLVLGTGGPMNNENAIEMDNGDELGEQAPEVFLDYQPQRCVTPEIPACLHTAEEHLAHLEDYVRAAETVDSATNVQGSAAPDITASPQELHVQVYGYTDHHPQQPARNSSDSLLANCVPPECRGYSPYMCWTPFTLPENNDAQLNNQYTSAVIVFNLGLVHQWFSKNSPKTAAFYEISAALLSSVVPSMDDCLRLRISLLNNFSVWCFENADGDAMRTSLDHLLGVLDDPVSTQILEPQVMQGIRTNIQWLLTPLNGGSPAA